MKESEIKDLLAGINAIITGSHIVYTSGRHGTAYINKDAIYPHTRIVSRLCRALVNRFSSEQPEVVIAPAVGGVILSQWAAHFLTGIGFHAPEVLGVYADKDGDEFVIKRGYDKLIEGKRVLAVEDILTTGGSAKKTIEAVRRHGGEVIGLGVICNRGGVTAGMVGDPPRLEALLNINLESWGARECPACAAGAPINTDVGHGKEFLRQQTQA